MTNDLYGLFFKVSALTFGGGYAMIPLFQDELVTRHQLLDATQFADLVALAQVTPGPVGLNTATYVGMTQAGIAGALAATLGAITPTFIFAFLAALFFKRLIHAEAGQAILSCVRPCICGIIAAAAWFFIAPDLRAPLFTFQPSLVIFLVILALDAFSRIKSPTILLLLAALLGILFG